MSAEIDKGRCHRYGHGALGLPDAEVLQRQNFCDEVARVRLRFVGATLVNHSRHLEVARILNRSRGTRPTNMIGCLVPEVVAKPAHEVKPHTRS